MFRKYREVMEMANKIQTCCNQMVSYQVEALISVDERGQMVLPKELREKAEIHPGDKLALSALEKDGKVCCLFLMKVEDLTGMVRNKLEPLFKEINRG
jgi:antitoxin PrlF